LHTTLDYARNFPREAKAYNTARDLYHKTRYDDKALLAEKEQEMNWITDKAGRAFDVLKKWYPTVLKDYKASLMVKMWKGYENGRQMHDTIFYGALPFFKEDEVDSEDRD